VVANLVENAVRYTPAAGRIEVRVEADGPDGALQQPTVPARSPSTRDPSMATATAVLSVSDTGMGIAPDDLPHVFERFYRADKARSRAHGGAGLGLSIAQYIVQAHGGSIEAISRGLKRGSTFRVRLPLTTGLAAERAEAAPPVASSRVRPASRASRAPVSTSP
jgi:signal transduction histidine kinase